MRNPLKFKVSAAAEEIAVAAYQLTETLPKHQRFTLSAQIQRSFFSSTIVE